MSTVEIAYRWSTRKLAVELPVSPDNAAPDIRLGAAVRIALRQGADLSRAVLTGAVLTGADLTGADLTGADLTDADLTGAVLSRAKGLPPIPIVPHIDAAILRQIERDPKHFEMHSWHGDDEKCNPDHWCETTHCRAGLAIALAGEAGWALERAIGPAAAGALIYAASRPGKPVPQFVTTNEAALADIRACAAEDPAPPQGASQGEPGRQKSSEAPEGSAGG